MPQNPVVAMLEEEHAQLLAALRRARDGSRLALHRLLWCEAGRNPSEIAAVLCCSRSRVCRTVRAYGEGTLGWEHDEQGRLRPPLPTTVRLPTLRRSLLAQLKAAPRTYGWCRTRWSCAPLAATLQAKRGIRGSAETRRRWVHEVGWVWKQATRVATDDAPHRGERLARLRGAHEPVQRWEALVFADELDIPLWPKVGCAWRPQGTHMAVMTPGTNETHDRPGPWIWRPAPCTTLWDRAQPMNGSGSCGSAWTMPRRPRTTNGSLWGSIPIRSIRLRPWSTG
jgi:transposase